MFPLNIDKYRVIRVICKAYPILKPYKVNCCLFSRVNSIKDLRICFEIDFSFKIDHKTILKESHGTLGFINGKTKDFRNPLCLKTIYSLLVVSNFDLGTVV